MAISFNKEINNFKDEIVNILHHINENGSQFYIIAINKVLDIIQNDDKYNHYYDENFTKYVALMSLNIIQIENDFQTKNDEIIEKTKKKYKIKKTKYKIKKKLNIKLKKTKYKIKNKNKILFLIFLF